MTKDFLMTIEAYDLLASKLKKAEEDFILAGKQLGIAADGEEHDNAPFDYAQIDYSQKKYF